MITGHQSADPGVVSLGLTTDRVCLISTLFDKDKNLPAKFWGASSTKYKLDTISQRNCKNSMNSVKLQSQKSLKTVISHDICIVLLNSNLFPSTKNY